MGEFDNEKHAEDFQRREKRLLEFQKCLEIYSLKHFERYGNELVITENSAAKITSLYFGWLESNVRPFVPKRINKYKISSLAELCIVKVQPFFIDNDIKSRKVNADFAFFCTLSIILGITMNIRDFNKPSGHKHVEGIFETVKVQRLQWLEAKNPNEFPVFSNGLSLYLLFELYHLRFQALAN